MSTPRRTRRPFGTCAPLLVAAAVAAAWAAGTHGHQAAPGLATIPIEAAAPAASAGQTPAGRGTGAAALPVPAPARAAAASSQAPAPAAAATAPARVPAPADVFGFQPGADYKLATHAQIVSYFRALDASSDRVVVEEIGRSVEGRPLILALISSEENLRNRERYREIARRLALARGVGEAEARRLAKDGRAVVWIDGGLHATEVAHAQHTPELAWWLATSDEDEAARMRANVILLLMPVMNPDGLDLVVEWYTRHLGTPFETAPVPRIYHHYIGHDNNRDWYMFTQVETKAVADVLYHRWFPQIVYNHHQSSPFPGRIWGPPFENPVNPNLDPLVVSSINQIGEHMRKRFDEEGKPGYNSGIVFDMWWNGSMRGAPDFHNMLGFLTETALYRYATPRCYAPGEIPETFGERANDLPAKIPTTDYTNPWPGGCWRLRDAVDYMLTASRAVLDIAARLKEDYLFNIWRMGARQIARGERAEGGPFAYVLDLAAQHDPTAVVEFLRTFRQGGVEIRQADRPFAAGGREYPAGTYVIPPQAFRPYVIDLMEPKRYPDRRQYPGGPPEPPYDMTGYELSLQMGVSADRIREPFPLPERAVEAIPPAPARVDGPGTFGHAFSATLNASARAANRLLASGARVGRAMEAFEAAGRRWAAGTFIVQGMAPDRLEPLARELGVGFTGLAAAPPVPVEPLAAPRVGLYRSHLANMDEGWVRWLLEGYGFAFRTVSDADVRKGAFDDLDILVFADEEDAAILNGHLPGTMPPEYVGGIGVEGAANVKRFVERGGWLLAIDHAVDFAIGQLGLPVRNVTRGLRPEEFFIPGSLVRVETRPASPLAFGMPVEAIALFSRSQALAIVPAAAEGERRVERDVEVFASYASKDFLASGWELGGRRYLAGRAAGVRVPLGQGQVVLLAFRPHFRGQPHNTYKLLFNALYASTLGRPAAARPSAPAAERR